jgi:DNA-binding SARP family transcriptional activator
MGALLAYLAVESKRPHLREALADMFWPDRPRGVARANLRQALLGIRQAVQDHESPSPLLEITASTIQFNRASNYLADIDNFEEQFRAMSSHVHESLETCFTCTSKLETATNLYRGDFLDGMKFR